MNNKLKTLGAILYTAASTLPVLAMAETPPAYTPPALNSLTLILAKICSLLNFVFAVLVLIAIIFVFVAAFKYLTAAGDPEKVSSANKTLVYAAVAIAVGLLAKAIPLIVASLLGAQIGSSGLFGTCT